MAKNRRPFSVTFGRDTFHGRRGPENPDPGDGFAPYRDGLGTGYELVYFRGQYLEKLSIQKILDDEAAEQSVWENQQDDALLSQLGFGTDGSTLK